jgi:RNA polymerase sigma-70 factor, ECF subfamily
LRREIEASAESPAVEAEHDLVGARDELDTALASLSPERRAVVVLRYVLGYTPGEIAKLLELPRGTVNSRLRRALDELAGEVSR